MKVNSTLWGLMDESGVGRGLEPVSNRVVSKIVKHGGGEHRGSGLHGLVGPWGVDHTQRRNG